MSAGETFGIALESLGEHLLPLPYDRFGSAVLQDLRSEQAYAAVMMLRVVPAEEVLTEAPSVLDRPEAVGEFGPVVECFELAFRKRIIVGDSRPAVGLGRSCRF